MKKMIVLLCLCLLVDGCKKNPSTINRDMEQQIFSQENENQVSINSLNLTYIQEKKVQMYRERLQQFYKNSEDEISYYLEYVMSEDEIKLVNNIVYQYLKNMKYKFVNDSLYDDQINRIFDVNKRRQKGEYEIIEYSHSFYIPIVYDQQYSKLTKQEKAEQIKSGLWQYNYGGNIGFVKAHHFIIELTPVTQLFEADGEKLLPEPLFFDQMFHRNNYLFNDSKASLTWLLGHDKEFLSTLVVVFNYDKEPRINKLVLEDMKKDYYSTQPKRGEILNNLFVNKDCNGHLQIREGLMKYIVENTTVKDYELVQMLSSYNTYVWYASAKELGLTRAEKFKFMAYAGYYEQLTRDKNNIDNPEDPEYTPKGWYPGGFLRNTLGSEPDLLKEIKKNNYYGLPNFQQIIESILYQIEEDSARWMRRHSDDL